MLRSHETHKRKSRQNQPAKPAWDDPATCVVPRNIRLVTISTAGGNHIAFWIPAEQADPTAWAILNSAFATQKGGE